MKRALVVALVLGMAATAAADTPEEQAGALFQKGTQHFNLAEWDEAIAAYKEGYRIVANPVFLYNIAQAYRQKGDCRQARTFYKSYLREDPEASASTPEKVQRRIEEMDACAATQPPDAAGTDAGTSTPTDTGTGTGTPTDPETSTSTSTSTSTPTETSMSTPTSTIGAPLVDAPGRPHPLRTVGLAVGGAGVVAVGAAVYFSMQAGDAADRIEAACAEGCEASEVAAIDSDGHAADRNAKILYIAGGVAIVAGAALVAWDLVDARKERSVAIVPTPGGAAITASLRW